MKAKLRALVLACALALAAFLSSIPVSESQEIIFLPEPEEPATCQDDDGGEFSFHLIHRNIFF